MAAVLRLFTRLTRRGIVLLAVGVVAYVLVEAVSFVQTYPDEASRMRLSEFGDQPAVRMLQGIPHAVETVGGFVVWEMGYSSSIGLAVATPGNDTWIYAAQ